SQPACLGLRFRPARRERRRPQGPFDPDRLTLSFPQASPQPHPPTDPEAPMTRFLSLLVLFAVTLAPVRATEPVALFDGQHTSKWYTYFKDHGKDKDPNGTVSVKDGILRISGQDFGGLITRDEYANYEVEVVWAWGGKVWPPREKTARDSGLIMHSTGEDGTV